VFSALKPASWPKLLVPMVLGQVLGGLAAGRLSPGGLAVGALFTIADAVFIVLANDWADREVDTVKRRLFPTSGSPKTIPDGLLPARWVLAGGLVAGGAAVATGVVGGAALGLPWLGAAGAVGVLVFVSYSLPPLALNYRGGGELLEAAGVGVVLPWVNAYAQCGRVAMPGLAWLAGFTALSLASAVASGLSDEESDRLGGKRTFATRFGNQAARGMVEGSLLVGGLLWAVVPVLHGSLREALAAAPAVGTVLFHARRLLRASAAATTSAFDAQRTYKRHLHLAIWQGALVLAAALAALRVAGT
jgi:4-hydroxybenzoate polyprenyltransferase